MEIIVINAELVAKGRKAFQALAPIVEYEDRGVDLVPGAIIQACLDGYEDRAGIVSVVAKVTRCRPATVDRVLVTLGSTGLLERFWTCHDDGTVEVVTRAAFRTLPVLTR